MMNTKLWMLPFRYSCFKDSPYQNIGKKPCGFTNTAISLCPEASYKSWLKNKFLVLWMWFSFCWNFTMSCTICRFAFTRSKAVREWFWWGFLCGTIPSNWYLKKKLRTFKIILCHKCICQLLPYLATAESRAPWLIWLFTVIYSQQMRKLKPNQTHAQLPPPSPQVSVLFVLF